MGMSAGRLSCDLIEQNMHTDAEGRLILCDALFEAAQESPDLLIDAATLTGAARVGLGDFLPALFSSDRMISSDILAAGIKEVTYKAKGSSNE